ncbi:MAG: agmatine deiminase family protein [Cyclobacteriaceae bacterium]|nr:agmatine deiminase family protein [Cyclobacteriaceae bacterium]
MIRTYYSTLLTAILSVILFFQCSQKTDTEAFYMPGEFEPHEAIWFGWRAAHPPFHESVAQMVKGLEGNVPIKIALNHDSLKNEAINVLKLAGVNTDLLRFYTMPGESYWIRDHGAAFLVNKKGEKAIVDFEWNDYGYASWLGLRRPDLKDSIPLIEQAARTKARHKVDSLMGVATGAKHIQSALIMEGGSLESNGKGVILQNESVTLNRNPGWSKEEIEEEYQRVLGAKKVIWMKRGLAEDEHWTHLHEGKYVTWGTGGHTDEFVRFADANTILLSWVDEDELDKHPLNRLNYERMQENYEILKAATDAEGKAFRIVKVPLPEPVERFVVVSEDHNPESMRSISPDLFLPGERPAAGDTLIQISASSYLNFLVSNGVVLNATYLAHGTSPEKEDKVKAIFEEVFPGRRLVWIDAMAQNWSGGGIHCSTQQEPLAVAD